MFDRIKKRNGEVVKFDANKISAAIYKAGLATGEFELDIAKKLTLRVLDLAIDIVGDRTPAVEEIQDIVEDVLITSPYKKTAKAYIIYRDQHTKLREITTKANLDLVNQYLNKKDWRVNENSNMSFSLQGLNNYVASEVTKTYWLNSIFPPEIRLAYINGDLHIHDMGCLSVYCVGWDLQDLITVGFKGAIGKVESKPAKHFRTALGQIVNFFYTLQGEAAGAQAFSNFDTLLAPFIRYDNLGYREVKQALQEFLFNVNVPTRVGFQTPFTNLTMDLTVPSVYRDQSVVVGGELKDKTYADFQKEMDMLNRAFLEVMLEGDAKGRVFTFPIPTYNITKDFDWNNPNMELLWQVTAKYGIPYFSNFINSDMKPDDVRSMCCRLRLDTVELRKRGGGLFGANPLTGSIGVVTVNLPRIGYLVNTKEEFFAKLDNLMVISKESLEIKRKIIEKLTDDDLYPYSKFYLRNVKERFGKYWMNHFSTIGIIGMNEACLNLFGEDIGTEKGLKFSIEVMQFMRKRLVEFQEETGNNYNLEATPAEGTSYRLARADKMKFPEIICANENDYKNGAEPFYTNSTHLPVNYTDDIFESLELQDEMQSLYTGGTVIHLYAGEKIDTTAGVRNLVKVICQKFRLPYFTITPTFSVCPEHGYIKGEVMICDKCRRETEIYSRVVGYLRPVNQWNKGKVAEFKLRKNYILK
ncbi:MAG TPA: ribonucleoside triphosphate reductase [bacterium]|nr:ribonucleoside triphosphate reductase [bacterium]